MALPIAASITTILLNIQAQLMSLTGLGEEAVHIVSKREIRFQADKEIYIMPGAPVRDSIVSDGSARFALLIRRPITVIIGARCILDTINDGTVALTDSTQGVGLLTTEEQVLQLTDTVLVDVSNNALLWEDIRFVGGGEPPTQDMTDEASYGYNYSVLVFEVAYTPILTSPVP